MAGIAIFSISIYLLYSIHVDNINVQYIVNKGMLKIHWQPVSVA